MHSWNINCTALALLALAGSTRAQNIADSPYSAYGFGDLVNAAQISQSTMGSVGVAVVGPFSVTAVNPATYPSLYTPVFEAGGAWRNATLTTSTQEAKRDGVQLAGLSLGIPFGKRKWGMAIGLQPYSNVGYLVTDQATTGDGHTVTFEYLGTGGLNRAYLGLGRVLWQDRDSVGSDNRRRDTLGLGNKLALGFNFNYLFGAIEQTSKAIYPQASGYYSTRSFSTLVVRDPTYTFGLLYSGQLSSWRRDQQRIILRDKRQRERHAAGNAGRPDSLRTEFVPTKTDTMAWGFHIGAVCELGGGLGARYSNVLHNYSLSGGVEVPRDTISFTDGERGNISVPPLFSLGFSITHGGKFSLSAEVRQRDWSRLQSDVEGWQPAEELGLQRTYALGLAWRPSGNTIRAEMDRGLTNLISNTVYRAGVRYNQDYLVVRGEQLNEIAVSAGLSIPVDALRSRSRITLGGEYGQRGTMDNGLIQERFTTLFVGLSFTPISGERWFVKRRID